jgi:hypothetical protein
MFTSSGQGSTPGVPGAHTASLATEQADSISEIFADGLGNGRRDDTLRLPTDDGVLFSARAAHRYLWPLFFSRARHRSRLPAVVSRVATGSSSRSRKGVALFAHQRLRCGHQRLRCGHRLVARGDPSRLVRSSLRRRERGCSWASGVRSEIHGAGGASTRRARLSSTTS